MIFLLDMNLSPTWCNVLRTRDIESYHWSNIGDLGAPDIEIFHFAVEHNYIIITCDMDFTTLLAQTGAVRPSVILIRARNIVPDFYSSILVNAIRNNSDILEKGAILVIDDDSERIRILPL
jgi:predicted nuclease of predicted toxin-antitoxin system